MEVKYNGLCLGVIRNVLNRNVCKLLDIKFINELGIVPVIEFFDKSSDSMLTRLPSSVGILPTKLFRSEKH